MTLYPPIFQQNDSYSALLLRQFVDAVVPNGGVLRGTDLVVSQRAAGANMSVDVSPGHCIVVGGDAPNQGKYFCWSDAVENVPLATAPGTGQSRKDLIVANVRDSTVIGGSFDDWQPLPVTGTPAATGSEVAPTPPPSSFVLAQIQVGPTVASITNTNITDLRSSAMLGVNATTPTLRTVTGDSGWGDTTPVPIAGSDITVNVTAGQRLRYTAAVSMFNRNALGTAATLVRVAIYDNGAQIQEREAWVDAAKNFPFTVSWIGSPSAGAHTYQTFFSTSGEGSALSAASGVAPATFLLENIPFSDV